MKVGVIVSFNENAKKFYLVVSNNINKFRTLRNWSLEELANRVGLSKKTIHRYERGEIDPDLYRIADIAEAFNVEITQLIEGAEGFFGINQKELNRVSLENEELKGQIHKYECENKELLEKISMLEEKIKGDFIENKHKVF